MAVAEAPSTADMNVYGIPKDPKTASDAVKSGSLKVTDKPEETTEGTLIETFKITVTSKDPQTSEETTHYVSLAQPFGWNKVAQLRGIFAASDCPITDDQNAFLGEAFSDSKQLDVIASLVKLYNDNERSKAKANEYQRIIGIFKPMTEEDRNSAIDRAIDNVVKAFGLSREKAREMVLAMNAAK